MIVIVGVIMLTLAQVQSIRSGPSDPTPTPSGWPDFPQFHSNGGNFPPVMPTVVPPKVTDLAPNIAYNDKVAIIVQHADGSREEFLLAPNMVDAFNKHLPSGDKIEGLYSLALPALPYYRLHQLHQGLSFLTRVLPFRAHLPSRYKKRPTWRLTSYSMTRPQLLSNIRMEPWMSFFYCLR